MITIRNCRATQVLKETSRHPQTYWNYIPRDILGVIIPYLPPSLWGHLKQLILVGKTDFKTDTVYDIPSESFSLRPDGSFFLHDFNTLSQVMDSQGHCRVLTEMGPLGDFYVQVSGGDVWHSLSPFRSTFILFLTDLNTQKQIDTRHYLHPLIVDPLDFVFDETGNCYLNNGNDHTILLLTSSGTVSLWARLLFPAASLAYHNGAVYFLGREGSSFRKLYKISMSHPDRIYPLLDDDLACSVVSFAVHPETGDIFLLDNTNRISWLSPGGQVEEVYQLPDTTATRDELKISRDFSLILLSSKFLTDGFKTYRQQVQIERLS